MADERHMKRLHEAQALVDQTRTVTRILGSISGQESKVTEYHEYLAKRAKEISLKQNLIPEDDLEFLKQASKKKSKQVDPYRTKFDDLDEKYQ